ncbi:unnamed protein product [Didymodactylos carnosus]|uniref:Uncharacterized protein n=1 Tax=Didymodactylos carnosus TaxID=1234261 RepID=A0A815IFL4_9BILA|nr:unnamed protein product [Didymodactylos carnosus]CAF4247160.1 unnamed protein product [Didymodactylos carnosus]
MARANLSSSSIDDDLVIDSPPPATQPINKEQLKLKFKLAVIDDIEDQKGREVKEKTNEIKSLLSKRTDRFTVVAHGVTKPHVAKCLFSLRPVSIVEDSGLRQICSYFYNLGEKNFGRSMDLESLFKLDKQFHAV